MLKKAGIEVVVHPCGVLTLQPLECLSQRCLDAFFVGDMPSFSRTRSPSPSATPLKEEPITASVMAARSTSAIIALLSPSIACTLTIAQVACIIASWGGENKSMKHLLPPHDKCCLY